MARSQQSSVSAWDAADFRLWSYIPYWATQTQINNFATNGMYSHVSDVLYFGGLRPDSNGNITYAASSYQTQFNTIRSQAQSVGFNLHLSMFEVTGGQTDATWTSIVNSPTARANFVSQLKTIMQGSAGTADDLKGFNFDWERPSTAALWGNYTQLARELGDAIHPLGMEVSVCDYGYPDTKWDDTSLFDARVYDQLFIMGYLYTASQNSTFATQHDALTGQGTAKAFKDSQIAIGVGTYTTGASTLGISSIVAANPNLAYNAGSYTGTIGGTTGTWNFESRLQVRQKTQVALDRGMQGMFSWTLHYDATNNMGLDRVMQHYAMVKRNIPDLNLDGKVNATDATTLANNMGTRAHEHRDRDGCSIRCVLPQWQLGKGRSRRQRLREPGRRRLARRAVRGARRQSARSAGILTARSRISRTRSGMNGRWKAGRNLQNNLSKRAISSRMAAVI